MKKTLKLSLTLVLAFVMLFAVAVIASAETEPTASGECGASGNNLIWEYYADTNTLVISGKGRMMTYALTSDVPWVKYRDSVKNLIIEEGVTSISRSSFAQFKGIEEVIIPDSVTNIYGYAFQGCSGIKRLHIGTGLKEVAKYGFNGCSNIEYLSAGSLSSWCQIKWADNTANPLSRITTSANRVLHVDGVEIVDLVVPEDVVSIGSYAFYNSRITSVTFNDNLTSIGRGAFSSCNALETMTFNNCSFKTNAQTFGTMNKLTTVYVNNLAAWVKNDFSTTGNPQRTKTGRTTRFSIIVEGQKLVMTPNSTNKAPESVTVYFPENTTIMNNAAFYGRKNLKAAYIPASVTSINGDTAGSRNKGAFNAAGLLTIYGEAGSYAETFAKNNKYTFVAITPVAVNGVELNSSEATVEIGASTTLTATVTPADATYKQVIWTSSNADVAYVSNGVVKALSAGTATITVTTSNGAFSDTCVITVPGIPVEGVELDKAEATLEAGHTLKLVPTFTPANASNKEIIWTSEDASIATVNNGIVTPVSNGTVTITATTVDGGFTAECEVTVVFPVVNVTGVTLDVTGAVLKVDETVKLTATVTPADADNTEVVWSSEDNEVATVVDGLVTAVAAGKTNIVVTTVDGSYTAKCAITVETPVIEVTGISLDVTAVTLAPTETLQLNATVTPADATDATVTWTSKNTAVATVVDGLVTAVADGEAIIEAKAGNFTATCTVKVETPAPEDVPVEEIALDVEELEIIFGETYQFEVIFTPEDTTERNLFWESTNEDVATIDENGLLTAIEPGITIITVLSEDNEDLYAECVVEVTAGKPVVGISLNKTTANVYVGDIVNLVVTFNPADATNKNVTWESSNDAIVTVEDGVVTAVAGGVATVTATSEDGEFTATCKFIVAVGNETPPIEWN